MYKMMFSTFVFSVFLISVSLIGYAQCKDPQLTPFGKRARKLICIVNFDKMFATNYKDDDELAKAVLAATKNLYMVMGIPFDETVVQKIDDENKSLGKSTITPELNFHVFTYAISMTLKYYGILNDDNIDELAQKFADEINKAAKNLDKYDIFSTLKALTTAVANFLKSVGINTKERVNRYDKYFYQELDMYQQKSSLLGKLLKILFGNNKYL